MKSKCPEPQILSIHLDGELPAPWNEKMEIHLSKCSVCRERLENFRQLSQLCKETGNQSNIPVETSLKKVWNKLEARRKFIRRTNGISLSPAFGGSLWQRRLSIPLPAAAAIALVILTILWIFGTQTRSQNEPADIFDRANLILAVEDEIPGIMPVADLNGVLQFLGTDSSEILIMRLPESRNFHRVGEPAMIRAAEYSRRSP